MTQSTPTSIENERGEETMDDLMIRGIRIPVRVCELDHKNLRFFAANPRIFSVIGAGNNIPSQEEITKHLQGMDHVKALIQDIKANGGLIDPVIVKDGTLEVLEGNSRLAAYRALSINEPIKWGRIKCKVLPQDIGEDMIFSLLAQYHVKGKKDWAPYEQAGFLYRRHKNQNVDISTLSKEIGLGQPTVNLLIDTYQFMIDHNQTEISRWSYYYEYLKSRKIKKIRNQNENFDDIIVQKISSGEIPKAADIRGKLQIIATAPKRIVNKFIEDEINFEEAYERAVNAGGKNSSLNKLSTFVKLLNEKEFEREILNSNSQIRKQALYDMRKLVNKSNSILKKMESEY